jgi:hypothetical protein
LADVKIRPDGIVEYRYRDGVSISGSDAQRVLERGAALTDEPHPTLVVASNVKHVDREARAIFAEGPMNASISSRVALVVATPVSRVLGNFFLGLNKPRFPTKLFSTEADAVAWLLKG